VDFERLTNQHRDAVYRQMVRVCGNQEDAEDVLIEALLRAYRHLQQLEDAAAFRAWLARIASRVCWRLKKREALLPLLQLSELEAQGRELQDRSATPEAAAVGAELKQQIQAALNALPSDSRRILELRDVEEVPGEEVAERLKISLAAMKSRLHRARRLLRTQLDLAFRAGVDESKAS
jgi:RNA polymerase sigma-70 factor (ECF subfamily)